jgi:hypothetical protein
MKSFADTAFFLLFEEILRRDRPKGSPGRWGANGIDWQYARHTFEGASYGYAVDSYQLTRGGTDGWSLLVVKESWWAGRHGESIRSTQWAKPLSGKRAAIVAWLRKRKSEFEHS